MSSFSKTQATTALSSAEAELYALCASAVEARFIVNMGRQLGMNFRQRLFTDSSAARASASRRGLPARCRHIGLSQSLLQELVRSEGVDIRKVKGSENIADLLTKFVDVKVWNELHPRLPMMVHVTASR